jgi:SAM-dependent methyltransferase
VRTHPPPGGLDPVAVRTTLLELTSGFLRTQAIAVAAELGIADRVGAEPVAVEELARDVEADPDALYRVLRLLAGVGVFAEAQPRRFVATALSDGLRDDAPLSARHIARLFGTDAYRAGSELLQAVRSGEPVAADVFGMGFFEHLAADGQAAERFDLAMAGGAPARAAAALAHPWDGVGTVVDVGGGTGGLLAAVLRAHPHLQGIVFDLPHVVPRARRVLEDAGVAGRGRAAGGDFFTDPIPAADVHVLAQILHDWADPEALAILRACRASLAPGGRLLVLEQVVPDEPGPSFATTLDLLMLVLLGGRERSADEWRTLLRLGGFDLVRITPAAGTNLIEAAPG